MNNDLEKLAPSKQSAAKNLFATFEILKNEGGQLLGKQVIDKIREKNNLTSWEKEVYEKTGYVRWESILHFYTIDAIKAGFLRKNKGIWYLTEEGEKSISLGPAKMLETASKLYRSWAADKKDNKSLKNDSLENEPIELEENQTQSQKANLDLLEEQAIAGIKEYIRSKNAYEFQDMVAALLRAMGYHTPFISPKGKDGGLDIIAYNDPLGATTPRLKVQVKHRPDSSVPVDDIRSLTGLLNKDGDIGLFVTSGVFTSESERSARESHRHIRLLDINIFIELWQEFYTKMEDEDKNMLPLHSIYFLGSND
ncbi:Mrr restriction system protein [Chryseobacterium shandongense]|uniref:Mrr restriction system protein n=1 Tax=Chryseobacterium shandongense TaxID=1493872 RepID=A0AAD0YGN8_9FLAO|nr:MULTISPECIES: Mrr restriction system protein [Chryseobacterium]AZA88735.1 Mrr restriction system protein [Chryseobacterium shandongense]AZA97277.1 Mrr restriction system protein [Chryseobacterium shandongense]